ncbi:MAG: phosphoglucosamine mutase [Candidatus Sumerlaeia bacterium]
MAKPMISVAGIRGTLGDSLVPEEFLKFAAAFCSSLDKKVVVLGGDTRPSRHMVRHLVFAAAHATGCKVLDLGIVPTPTIGFMARELGAGGGIGITASHNPLNWNALKFFSDKGVFLTSDEMAEVLKRYDQSNFDYVDYDQLGTTETVDNPAGPHLKKVLDAVDVEAIRAKKFKVAIDLCNGAGVALLPDLLERLGCEVVPVFDDVEKAFERTAEPLPENLGALSEAVNKAGAAVGFAVDPDADRLALVDETGRPIGEERTLTLIARAVLQKAQTDTPPPLVANLSTTRALEDVAAEFGTTVERTKIGEAHVVQRIGQVKALIGGEGNGGVIYPAIHSGRDAAAGIGLLLQAMAESGKSLSSLNNEVPDYVMVKQKVGIEGKDVALILSKLRETFADANSFDDIDGLKISFADSWIHVRPSGTEPILRVFTEAPDRKQAENLAKKAMAVAAQ